MKVIVYADYTRIFPTDDEITTLCKPGQRSDTCVWLICGVDGFECCLYNKPYDLLDRWSKGKTVAKRDGCDKVNKFYPCECDTGEIPLIITI